MEYGIYQVWLVLVMIVGVKIIRVFIHVQVLILIGFIIK
jgi:hypothetical protein